MTSANSPSTVAAAPWVATVSAPVFRPEIQALRAVAILSVLLYHLWPNRLTGGYLGVDVFFVISGFLITSHLLRDSTRGFLSLPKFWARRIRRLLPASLTVLLVTGIAVLALVPQRLWEQYLGEIVASTVYAQNWFLAASSVDYLGSENEPSPVQHFWSLSTEEQFYVVWPLLIALALVLWRVTRKPAADATIPRRLLFGILLVVTVSSFAYAIYATATDPAPAFFATTTRAWEFGAGSLLAFAATSWLHGRLSDHVRGLMAWAGWITIAASVSLFTDNTVHPGLLTLIPVLGSVLVIWAGSSESRLSPSALTKLRPVQFIGDISYSLYLWHWPFIVVVPIVTGNSLGTRDKLVIIIVAFVLAYLSYRFIEKPTLRLPLAPRDSTRRWFIGALVAALIVAALPAAGFGLIAQSVAADKSRIDELITDDNGCFGAAVVGNEAECAAELDGLPLVPSTATAATDALPLPDGCIEVARDEHEADPCLYRQGTGATVLLVGDSHAEQLRPMVLALADEYDWTVWVATKGRCAFSDAERTLEQLMRSACADWGRSALDFVEDKSVDVVLTSQVSGVEFAPIDRQSSDDSGVAGLVTRWQGVLDAGAKVVVIRDNPRPIPGVQLCLEENWPSAAQKCSAEPETAFLFDPQLAAAEEFSSDDVHLLDFADLECTTTECPAVIGGVNVYKDANHLTQTFVRTLGPIAIERLPAAFTAQ